MRIPKINDYNQITNKELVNVPDVTLEPSAIVFFDEKQRTKFVKRIELICRGSLEYKEFIDYLRTGLGMHYCTFFNNVDRDQIRKVRIEIHHLPFSLYDIASIVLRKWEMEGKPINDLLIAEEVMQCHYKGMVGLVPLSATVHELYHRGDIFIPLQYVDKGFITFYETYKPYISDQQVSMLKDLVVLSKSFDMEKNNILQKKLIYVENENYNSTPERV